MLIDFKWSQDYKVVLIVLPWSMSLWWKVKWQRWNSENWNFTWQAALCVTVKAHTILTSCPLCVGDAFSIIPPCTMKYVVKATCRIKRHSKTKASQIVCFIIPQSACRVGLPDLEIANLCNSYITGIFIYYLSPVCHSFYLKCMSFVLFFVFFGPDEPRKSLDLQRSARLSSV